MFWLTAAVVVLSNTAFFFFSSGDLEKWDSNEEVDSEYRFMEYI